MKYTKVKDSGKRQEFKSGAVRDNQSGKGRYDLLPTRAIRRLAEHYENGAVKYGDNNWLKGIPLKRMMDSALRHIFKALEGQTDEDHLTAAAWNILGIIELQERIEAGMLSKELDNLPKLGKKDNRPFIEKGKNKNVFGGLGAGR
jgi:hypothetical protein